MGLITVLYSDDLAVGALRINIHTLLIKRTIMNTKQYLGYLGLAPFVLALTFENWIEEIFNRSSVQVFVLYSAIILSFIAGTLWRKQNDKLSIKLQLVSNLFSLLAFLALLIPYELALITLAIAYVVLLLGEYHCDDAKPKNHHYLVMRLQLTTLVVTMHIIAFVLWGI